MDDQDPVHCLARRHWYICQSLQIENLPKIQVDGMLELIESMATLSQLKFTFQLPLPWASGGWEYLPNNKDQGSSSLLMSGKGCTLSSMPGKKVTFLPSFIPKCENQINIRLTNPPSNDFLQRIQFTLKVKTGGENMFWMTLERFILDPIPSQKEESGSMDRYVKKQIKGREEIFLSFQLLWTFNEKTFGSSSFQIEKKERKRLECWVPSKLILSIFINVFKLQILTFFFLLLSLTFRNLSPLNPLFSSRTLSFQPSCSCWIKQGWITLQEPTQSKL